jgi:hypothetical protein
MTMTAPEVIELLRLEPLPEEGGYFRQTYKSSENIPPTALPARYRQEMSLSTAIYFLITPADFSAMHRLNSAEVYHFYLGDPVELLLLYPDGSGEVVRLGQDLPAGVRPQQVVETGVWQGARLQPGGPYGFALMGTTMAPGFEVSGFELGSAATLSAHYPAFSAQIAARVR